MQGKEITKKSKLLRYIFIAKKFINKAKKNLFIQRNEKYNIILAREFKRNQLQKRIFELLNSFYLKFKETRRLVKK